MNKGFGLEASLKLIAVPCCPSSFLEALLSTVTLRSPWSLLQMEYPQLSQPISIGDEVRELPHLHNFQLLCDSRVMGLCLWQ